MDANQTTPRRAFLAQLSLGTAGVAGVGAVSAHAAPLQPRLDLAKATLATFSPFVGKRFRIIGEAGAWHEMVLNGAEPMRSSGDGNRPANLRAPFALTFRGSSASMLPQQTYEVEDERLGRFHVFLVPTGADSSGADYVAVFN